MEVLGNLSVELIGVPKLNLLSEGIFLLVLRKEVFLEINLAVLRPAEGLFVIELLFEDFQGVQVIVQASPLLISLSNFQAISTPAFAFFPERTHLGHFSISQRGKVLLLLPEEVFVDLVQISPPNERAGLSP